MMLKKKTNAGKAAILKPVLSTFILALVMLSGLDQNVQAQGPLAGDIIMVDQGAFAVMKVDPVSGQQDIISQYPPGASGIRTLLDVTVEADGNILFVDGDVGYFPGSRRKRNDRGAINDQQRPSIRI